MSKIEKAAVYSGTRNLYPDMVTAAKSLVHNTSVEKIFFLIEDDEFPSELPPMIETMNVSGQGFFPPKSANIKTKFSYMALLRVCYTKLFPELDKILQLDVDTIAVDKLADALFDVNLKDKWFAAVHEDFSKHKPYGRTYYNIGVALFNLAQIRKDGIDEHLINFLNTTTVPYIDQDAWNRFGIGKDVKLDVRFNESCVTGYTEAPIIVHYAGWKDWQTSPRVARREYIRRYREMSWEDALKK